MVFADDMPNWVGWLIAGGGATAITQVTNFVIARLKERRSNRQADEERAAKKKQDDEEKGRKVKLEDESRAIQHLETANAALKADIVDLKKQIADMKVEMREMQAEARRAADVAAANLMRAERFRLYSEHLEDLLTRNEVTFRRWSEDDDSATHPALPPGA